jgi:putative ubiquitin-RnfH superfamily antitoxin RatB of RatAB toxin-antitoxin module
MTYIAVEVFYSLPDRHKLIQVFVTRGSTIKDAILQSGILGECPETDLQQRTIELFGKKVNKPDRHQLKASDRIEIY